MQHLVERDVSPYCPMFLEPPWHPRAPRGPSPLFTGYIFVYCHPETQLNAVRFCPCVLRPVVFDGRLATVDQRVVDDLRFCEGERGYILPAERSRTVSKGSRVRIMTGPFSGCDGIFRGYLRGQERAKVFLDFLRSRLTVEIDADSMMLVQASA